MTNFESATSGNSISAFFRRLTHSWIWGVFVLVYIAYVTYEVTQAPRSLLWRILFLGGLLLIYFMPQPAWLKLIYGAVVTLILVPVIGVGNPFILELGFQICLFATLALGLNIVVGFSGLLDLGYIAFFAVGAYLWAFYGSQQLWNLAYVPGSAPAHVGFPLSPNYFWIFVLLGTCVAAFAGVALGTPVLRLRGDYLAIVTLGFGEVIRVLANNLSKPVNFTNGPQGITPIQRPDLPLILISPAFREWLSGFAHRVIGVGDIYGFYFYLLTLIILALTVVLVRRLENSKMGRAWNAIREDEVAAIAMGVPLVRSKLAAFAIGASFSGAMGVIFAANRTFVSPETFSLTASISILVMVILGGLGSIPGVIVGAAVVTLLNIDVLQTISLELSRLRQTADLIPFFGIPWSELPSQLDPARYQRLVFGIILILMMIFRPEGIIPATAQNGSKRGRRSGDDTRMSAPILQLENVTKRFGGLTAVNNVSLDIPSQRIVSIIGPNGAGKTTLFNIITGIYKPDEGSLSFDGLNIAGRRPDQITALGMCRTFQNIRLFHNLSVIENVLVGAHTQLPASTAWGAIFRSRKFRNSEESARLEARRLLRFVGLPVGTGDRIAKNLPYGQQRKVEIARALAAKPKLILLDEPTAGMNPQETEEAIVLFRRLRDELGVTVLLIEHDMKVIMGISERISVVDYGQKIAEGTPAEVRKNQRVIEAYLGRQAQIHDEAAARQEGN